jgi:WD40 repeat protein
MIATSSEDQKTHIWNLWGEKLATLEGHTTAVTSVDWAVTSIGEIIATCADDQTVRIYQVGTWELLHVFETKEVEEW